MRVNMANALVAARDGAWIRPKIERSPDQYEEWFAFDDKGDMRIWYRFSSARQFEIGEIDSEGDGSVVFPTAEECFGEWEVRRKGMKNERTG